MFFFDETLVFLCFFELFFDKKYSLIRVSTLFFLDLDLVLSLEAALPLTILILRGFDICLIDAYGNLAAISSFDLGDFIR